MRYKLTIEYDGTNLLGWQEQQDGPSVQDYLQKSLSCFTPAPADECPQVPNAALDDNNFIGHLQVLSGTRLLTYVYVRCGSAFRGSTIMCLTKIIVV